MQMTVSDQSVGWLSSIILTTGQPSIRKKVKVRFTNVYLNEHVGWHDGLLGLWTFNAVLPCKSNLEFTQRPKAIQARQRSRPDRCRCWIKKLEGAALGFRSRSDLFEDRGNTTILLTDDLEDQGAAASNANVRWGFADRIR
jgi:hypothetical protein